MTGHVLLLELGGAVALLVWAARLVRTGMERAFGARLQAGVRAAAGSWLSALGAGLGTAALLQSSTATALLLIGFTERGVIALAPALAAMLGADVGSSLVVQALAFDMGALAPALLLLGTALFLGAARPMIRNMGRIGIGLGLMLTALGMIGGASEPLRGDPLLGDVLARVGSDAILAIALSALLTWLAHSSVAAILFFASLASNDVIPPETALVMVLGANLGAGLIPLGLAARGSPEAKRVLIGNLGFRAMAVVAALPFAADIARLAAEQGWSAPRQVANAHTAFNLALAVVFLPFAGLSARLLERAFPAESTASEQRLRLLDPAALDRPKVALASAAREALRLAETVELMLRQAIRPFSDNDMSRVEEIRHLDANVDERCAEIVRYLTRLMRRDLSAEDSREAFDLILFTTNLEHVGDIIDKNLLPLALKKQRLGLSFSREGWRELERMHALSVEHMRNGVAVFVTRDLAMARDLVHAKDEVRAAERRATESHLQRLREGGAESIETSSLHIDMLRDLKRIIAHVTVVAHPILEAAGELGDSRLRTPHDLHATSAEMLPRA